MKRPEGLDRREVQQADGDKSERRPTPPKPTPLERTPRKPNPTRDRSIPGKPTKPSREESADARATRRRERAEARRFTRNSRRRRYTTLVVAGTIVALLSIMAVAVFSPLLALRTITVVGTSAISPAAVKQAVSDQLGTPLALLDPARLRSDLSSFRLIRSYVTTVIPPSTLVIHIVEREAVGVLRAGKSYDQVDPAGVVLARSPTPAGLPVIEIGRSKAGSPAFTAAVEVLVALPASVAHLVQTVSASSTDDVSLTLTGTTNTVFWGDSSQPIAKAAALSDLLSRAECKPQAVIDVSAPSLVACGPVHVAPTAAPTPTP